MPVKFCATPIASAQVYEALAAAYKSIPRAFADRNDHSFTRGGVLSPELLTTFLLYMVADGNRYGIRHLVLDFWNEAAEQGILLPTSEAVSPSAICQARQRLPDDLFRYLLYGLADQAGQHIVDKRWRGQRVFAVDGARINVRPTPDLKEAFGVAKGAYTPQILLSTMVDVCTRMPVDYEVDGRKVAGEREHLLRMLPSIERGDLLILDRGYPSYEVLRECAAAGVDFLIRTSSSQTFTVIHEFRDSGRSEEIVTMEFPDDVNSDVKRLTVRLIRIEGPNGPAFYMTSLSEKRASIVDIADLYHMRWEVEEYFKLFTSEYAGQKQFRSSSVHGVRQEVGALTLFLAMSRVLATAADAALVSDDESLFVSQKGAVAALTRNLIAILLEDDPEAVQARIQRTLKRILGTLDKRRPGRSFPRVSLKPRRRWGPRGNTRA